MEYSVKHLETQTVTYDVYIFLGDPKKKTDFSDISNIVENFGVENFREIDPFTEDSLGEYLGDLSGVCNFISGYESESGTYSEKTDLDPVPEKLEKTIQKELETLFQDVTVLISE